MCVCVCVVFIGYAFESHKYCTIAGAFRETVGHSIASSQILLSAIRNRADVTTKTAHVAWRSNVAHNSYSSTGSHGQLLYANRHINGRAALVGYIRLYSSQHIVLILAS